MRARVSDRLRAFMDGKSTAPAPKRAPEGRCCGARAFLWHVVLPALGVALAASVVFGLGAAFSAWRRGEPLALPRSLSTTWQAPPIAGPAPAPLALARSEAARQPAPLLPRQPQQQPPPQQQPLGAAAASTAAVPGLPSAAAPEPAPGQALTAALRAEALAFQGALRALAEERAYAEAQRAGVSLYAPLLPWEAPPSAAQGAAAAGAAALLGQACGFPSAEEGAKKGYSCAYHSAPGEGVQCCCSRSDVPPPEPPPAAAAALLPRRRALAPARRAFVCLPTLIIAGAQKSGSTALTGHLLRHPNFAPSVRKEVHFFDRYHARGLEWYLSYMPPTPRQGAAQQLTGEASPAYMLGTVTAERIAAALPQGRVVVLLREPAARAYSEWNMKVRRVQGQVRAEDAASAEGAIYAPLHACLAQAWAPIVPLLTHAAHIASGAEFGGAGEEPLFLLQLDPLRDAAVTAAVRSAWAAVLGEGGEAPASSSSSSSSAALRYTMQSTESWTVLVNGLSALAAGRGSGSRRGGGAQPLQQDTAAAVAATAAEGAGLGLVGDFFSAHWALHGRNYTERCLREKVLPVSNGLGSIYRALPKAADVLSQCLVGRLTPPSASLLASWGLGKGAGGSAAPALLSNLWGLMSAATSTSAAAHGGMEQGGLASAPAASGASAGSRQQRARALQQLLVAHAQASPALWLMSAAPHASEALLGVLGYALERAGSSDGSSSSSSSGGGGGGGGGSGAEEEEEEELARQARRKAGGVRGRSLGEAAPAAPQPSAAAQEEASLQRLIAAAGGAMNAHLHTCFSTLESSYAEADAKLPIRYEEIDAFEGVVAAEMEELSKCSAEGLSEAEVLALMGVEGGEGGNSSGLSLVLDGRESCWLTGTTSNIAGDFLYRSMYLRQVVRLHQALGKDKVLVLTTEGLRHRPQRTLDTLCRFLGLPRINVTAAVAASSDSPGGQQQPTATLHTPDQAIARLLETVYPQFGPRTGWRLDGDYEPMGEALSARLKGFFEPFNRALFAYLGEGAAQEMEQDWALPQ